jgi:hypothetical protein
MTGGAGAKDSPGTINDEELDPRLRDPHVQAWFSEHLTEVRRVASGRRPVLWPLGIAVVAGLIAHVGGYLLRSSATTEALRLLADLLYALGYALWTGVVVAVFVQILPEAKRRQYERALEAYEATQRDQAQAEGGSSTRQSE